MIENQHGAPAGSGEMLGVYQRNLSTFIDELPEEEWEKARQTAEEWNKQGAAPEAQAK